jgi:GDP-L-fucose synthase
MKILLTGASGMVGRNLLENENILSKFDVLAPTSKELNLLNYVDVEDYIGLNKPDLIIHAAGRVGGIQANIANPISFLTDNMDMGRNIVLAAKNKGIKRLINLGSSCMYPKNAENPLSEDLILKGELEPTNEGYALAKIITARLCEYVNKENENFMYKTIIPCNLYGKYDKFSPKHSHMLPAVVKKIHEAKVEGKHSIDIWGDGLARREFMYVSDLTDFIYFAIKNFETMPQNINVGIGHDYSINEYYRVIADIIGFKGDFVYDLSKPIGMKQKLMSDQKIKEFGWQHSIGLREGVEKIYSFYKKEIIQDEL